MHRCAEEWSDLMVAHCKLLPLWPVLVNETTSSDQIRSDLNHPIHPSAPWPSITYPEIRIVLSGQCTQQRRLSTAWWSYNKGHPEIDIIIFWSTQMSKLIKLVFLQIIIQDQVAVVLIGYIIYLEGFMMPFNPLRILRGCFFVGHRCNDPSSSCRHVHH